MGRRLRLLVEYDGTGFAGFQRQPGRRTVQGLLETHLAVLCGHPVQVTGAGRTDAGVHALGQVVHCDVEGRIPTERVAEALNIWVGPEVVVRHADEVDETFHARYSAVRRTYRYRLSRKRPHPLRARYTVHAAGLLPDAAGRMQAGADYLVGKHDFTGFSVADGEARAGAGIRRVETAEVTESASGIRFGICADGFLRSMVRLIVGLLLAVGRGEREPEAVAAVLEAGKRPFSITTAPPHGLILMRVDYPDGFPGNLATG